MKQKKLIKKFIKSISTHMKNFGVNPLSKNKFITLFEQIDKMVSKIRNGYLLYSLINRLAEEHPAFKAISGLIELIRDSIRRIRNRNRLGDGDEDQTSR